VRGVSNHLMESSKKTATTGMTGTDGKTNNTDDGLVNGVKEYVFNRVFTPADSQADVYNGIAAPMVDGLFPSSNNGDTSYGNSALLFSYGITNAGKTYTIMGKPIGSNNCNSNNSSTNTSKNNGSNLQDIDEAYGIIPRVLHQMFTKMKMSQNTQRSEGSDGQAYKLRMSYFEIYNEKIFDLLPIKKKTSTNSRLRSHFQSNPSLTIREGRNGRTCVCGLGKHLVASVAQGLKLVNEAKSKCHTSSNNINTNSSRSHCICQFELIACQEQDQNQEDDSKSVSSYKSGFSTDDESISSEQRISNRSVMMQIVDLAGSERSKRTGAMTRSAAQKESSFINSSLMKLMRCFNSLQSNNRIIASSFRESKLTHLFMNHFLSASSASRTRMIININPSVADFDETQHVLNYAAVAKNIYISKSDYNHKTRAIQICDNNSRSTTSNIQDDNKRHIRSNSHSTTFPPRKIARITTKLSSRDAIVKRREQLTQETKKRRDELQSIRCKKLVTREETKSSKLTKNNNSGSNANSTSNEVKELQRTEQGCTKLAVGAKLKGSKLSKNSNGDGLEQYTKLEGEKLKGDKISKKNNEASSKSFENDINILRTELNRSYVMISRWDNDPAHWTDKCASCESEVRMELAEETQAQMKYMQENHKKIVHHLNQKMISAPTPSRSVRKAKIDKAEEIIEDLMDKVEECEEEMGRIKNHHMEEISRLTDDHINQLKLKDDEILELKILNEEENLNQQNEELNEMKEKVDDSQTEKQIVNNESTRKDVSSCRSVDDDAEMEKENYDNEKKASVVSHEKDNITSIHSILARSPFSPSNGQ